MANKKTVLAFNPYIFIVNLLKYNHMQAMPEMAPQMPPPHIFLEREPEKNRPDKLIEAEIEPTDLSRYDIFDYGKAVQLFRQNQETNREGKSREIETEFQNRIIRYMAYKPSSQLEELLQKICTQAQRQTNRPELKKSFEESRRKLFGGIKAVIDVIRDTESKFDRNKRIGKIVPGTELFLGTNNTMDAKSAIDLVAIQYNEAGPSEIELHQVKSMGSGTLTPKEIRDIIFKHQQFIDGLAGKDYAAAYMLSREALIEQERNLSDFFKSQQENKVETRHAEYMQRYEELFLSLLTDSPKTFDEDALEEYLQKNSPTLTILDLYQLFHLKKSGSFFEMACYLSLGEALNPEHKQTAQKLREFCLGYLPPAQKWGALYDNFQLDPALITQDAKYVSVIDHAGPQIKTSLQPSYTA